MSSAANTSLTECMISVEHPSLPGHFPGQPIVPGVVMLNEVLAALQGWQPGFVLGAVPTVKFMRPLLPGESFSIRLELAGKGFRFECFTADHMLAKGSLQGHPAPAVQP